jgi:phospholipid-binding lipoprotein MlaA
LNFPCKALFANGGDIFNAANNALQGKFKDAGSDLCRVAINSTVGLLGCFDVATELGFEKHTEDFGQTLATWGVGAGPYIVLPFLGASTVRDSVGTITELYLDPFGQIPSIRVRNSVRALKLVDKRAILLEATDFADDAALDKYKFYRDAYLQRRRYLIYDGDPPDDPAPKYDDEEKQSTGELLRQPNPALVRLNAHDWSVPATQVTNAEQDAPVRDHLAWIAPQ